MRTVPKKAEYKLVGKDGEEVSVGTLTDFQEYVKSGWYTPATGEKNQVIEDAVFAEVKDESIKADLASIASEGVDSKAEDDTEKKVEGDEPVDLDSLTKDELQEIHKDLFGSKKAGNVSEATLVSLIKEKQEEVPAE